MDNPDDPFFWLIAEALQQLGSKADPTVLADRIRRLQRGLPAEDEFSMILTWLGRCRLVHKLDQLQSPRSSRRDWQVPDMLAVFDYHGHQVPVLIEVKTTPFSNNQLSWPVAYREAIVRYADLMRLPLLVAWRFGNLWALVDANQLKPAPIRYKVNFGDAMKHSLMTELAGDFMFSQREGVGSHFKFRKEIETEETVEAVIEDAYWTNADGERVDSAPGVFPLFTYIDQEVRTEEDGRYITRSFVIPSDHASQFASRALATLLRLAKGRDDDARWRRALEQSRSTPFAPDGLRQAAAQAGEAGFLQSFSSLRPHVVPDFLLKLQAHESAE